MPSTETYDGYLVGHLLVATPAMGDSRFDHTVIYLCAHNDEGAMGLVINRAMRDIDFSDLLEQLDIDSAGALRQQIIVHAGGPVDTGRGFVLHTPDYQHETTVSVDDSVALTASVDIIRAIVEGHGPERCLLALGYAGWSAGQLEQELKENAWIAVPPDDELLFGDDLMRKWEAALGRLGISGAMLSTLAGNA